MITSTSNIAEYLPALPLPRVFLLYGKAKLLFQPEERLFQWWFGNQQRIQCIESTGSASNAQKNAKEALQALKDTFFKPVIIFDKGESSNALAIFDYNLPNFEILEAMDNPKEVEYALCNPEASVESIWYPLLEGEAIAEPPAIWREPKFLGNYGEAFLQWLCRHPERHGMEPLADLKLDDFTIDIPQPEGHYRLCHQFFPLAWLDIERGDNVWQATPGGALDGIDADELYILYDKEDMALMEVSGKVWESMLVMQPSKVKPIIIDVKSYEAWATNLLGKDFREKILTCFDYYKDALSELFDNGSYALKLTYARAAVSEEETFPLGGIGGEWSIIRVVIPGSLYQTIKFRCDEKFKECYEGRLVTVKIGDQEFDLGKIFYCAASTDIPVAIDISQGITVTVGKVVDDSQ